MVIGAHKTGAHPTEIALSWWLLVRTKPVCTLRGLHYLGGCWCAQKRCAPYKDCLILVVAGAQVTTAHPTGIALSWWLLVRRKPLRTLRGLPYLGACWCAQNRCAPYEYLLSAFNSSLITPTTPSQV
jgi:hypothetical protein